MFHLAIEKKAILLTGESTLRNCAKRAGIEARGISRLFALMVEQKVLTPAAAIKAMEKLIASNI